MAKLLFRKSVWIAALALGFMACTEPTESNMATDDYKIAAAEKVIDAFYAFDSDALLNELGSAGGSIPDILYYQGWAEGGNYKVVERKPCVADSGVEVSCSITVEDDLMAALGIDFNVTDTFHFAFSEREIVAVTTSSNDLKAYYDAQEWVEENQPEVFDGPCKGFFAGGPTPGDCVRAMVKGYSEFVASGGLSDGLGGPN